MSRTVSYCTGYQYHFPPSPPATNQKYSVFTQVQLEGLENDIARVEAGVIAPKKMHATPATNQEQYSFHTQHQMDELSSDDKESEREHCDALDRRAYCQERRVPSKREFASD